MSRAEAPSPWPCLRASRSGCTLALHVVPNSAHTVCEGLHDGALRVRLTAPAVDGQANAALVQWLARELQLTRRAVRVLRGGAARRKQVQVDAPHQHVAQWLARVLNASC